MAHIASFAAGFGYDAVLAFFTLVVNTYFREIELSGLFVIPEKGPVVFVIAPHANQFLDPLLVMEKVKEAAGRRIAFLIAAKSYKQRFIGTLAKTCHAIPVERPQDNLKPATGSITVVNDDRKDSEGKRVKVKGQGTKFTEQCHPKGLIGLPNSLGNTQVESVESDTVLYLKKPFSVNQKNPSEKQKKLLQLIEEGTAFKVADPIDNHVVFKHVFTHLNEGRVLGIFPEGGSHDRPNLLPLKAGVAIMALGAVSSEENKEPITVIPTGMNYFHPDKFRSRCVVQFGHAITVDKDNWGARYESNSKDAISDLLQEISLGLEEVTVNCNDYDTLKVIQCARRLFTSTQRTQIPLPMVVEMNRRLIKGYEQHKDDADVIQLRDEVLLYDTELRRLGIHDHQVETIENSKRIEVFWRFASRLFQVFLFCGLALPGVFLFSPVFIVAKRISKRKSKEALEGSLVKVKAKDVVATWKVLVALVWAPCIYIFWSIIGTFLLVKLDFFSARIPTWIIFVGFYLAAVFTTYASLRVGEIGVDYYKSLKPLFYSVLSIQMDFKQLTELKKKRERLAMKVERFCDQYGPSIFDDFDEFYDNYNSIEKGGKLSLDITLHRKGHRRDNSSSSLEFNKNDLSNIPIFSSVNDDTNESRNEWRNVEAPKSYSPDITKSAVDDFDKPGKSLSVASGSARKRRPKS